jgi:hypothetical protein
VVVRKYAKQTLFLGVQLGEFLRWATGLSSERGRLDAMVVADSKGDSDVRYRSQQERATGVPQKCRCKQQRKSVLSSESAFREVKLWYLFFADLPKGGFQWESPRHSATADKSQHTTVSHGKEAEHIVPYWRTNCQWRVNSHRKKEGRE